MMQGASVDKDSRQCTCRHPEALRVRGPDFHCRIAATRSKPFEHHLSTRYHRVLSIAPLTVDATRVVRVRPACDRAFRVPNPDILFVSRVRTCNYIIHLQLGSPNANPATTVLLAPVTHSPPSFRTFTSQKLPFSTAAAIFDPLLELVSCCTLRPPLHLLTPACRSRSPSARISKPAV